MEPSDSTSWDADDISGSWAHPSRKGDMPVAKEMYDDSSSDGLGSAKKKNLGLLVRNMKKIPRRRIIVIVLFTVLILVVAVAIGVAVKYYIQAEIYKHPERYPYHGPGHDIQGPEQPQQPHQQQPQQPQQQQQQQQAVADPNVQNPQIPDKPPDEPEPPSVSNDVEQSGDPSEEEGNGKKWAIFGSVAIVAIAVTALALYDQPEEDELDWKIVDDEAGKTWGVGYLHDTEIEMIRYRIWGTAGQWVVLMILLFVLAAFLFWIVKRRRQRRDHVGFSKKSDVAIEVLAIEFPK